MASLTPLSKGLIGLAVVGAVVSAVWHLGLKEWVSGMDAPQASSSITTTAPSEIKAPETPVAPPPPAATASVAPPIAPAPEASAPAKPAEAVPPASNSKVSPVAHLSPAESGEMGRKFLDSGDYAQARIYLEHAVKGGDGAAACHLGEMTLKGQGGLPADQEKAASYFQMAQSRNIICFASGR